MTQPSSPPPETPEETPSDRLFLQFGRKAAMEIPLPGGARTPRTPEFLTIEVDGTTVTGWIVSRSRREVVVEIQSPYQGYRHAHACNLFALAVLDYRDERGEALARNLLGQLYLGCRQLDTVLNGDTAGVARFYQRMREEQAAVPPVSAAAVQHRHERRAALKAGQCTQAEYRDALQQLRAERQNRDTALRACEERLFDRLGLSERQPPGRDETLSILVGLHPLRRVEADIPDH